MLIISYAGYSGQSLVISAFFILEMCKKIIKTSYFRVQGRLRSSISVTPDRSSAVLVMVNSKSVPICNRFLR